MVYVSRGEKDVSCVTRGRFRGQIGCSPPYSNGEVALSYGVGGVKGFGCAHDTSGAQAVAVLERQEPNNALALFDLGAACFAQGDEPAAVKRGGRYSRGCRRMCRFGGRRSKRSTKRNRGPILLSHSRAEHTKPTLRKISAQPSQDCLDGDRKHTR